MKNRKKKIIIVLIVILLSIVGISVYFNFFSLRQSIKSQQIEALSNPEYLVTDYMAGSSRMLEKCQIDSSGIDEVKVGNYELKITCADDVYIVDIEVVDNTPPEFTLKNKDVPLKNGSIMLLGEKYNYYDLDYDVKDVSMPVRISFEGDKQKSSITITEDMITENGDIELPVWVTDSIGNKTCVTVEASFYTDEELLELLPEGYFEALAWEDAFTVEEKLQWQEEELSLIHSFIEDGYSIEKIQATYQEYLSEYIERNILWEQGRTFANIIEMEGIEELGIEIRHVYATLGKLPENVVKKFNEEGWKLCFTIDNLKEKYNTDVGVSGVTSYDLKKIEVNTESTTYTDMAWVPYSTDWINDDTIIHEFGHFIDYMCNWSSEQDYMKIMYEIVKKESGATSTYKIDDITFMKEGLVYSDYSFSTEREFFADTVVNCLIYPEEIQKEYPELYEYVMNCINLL